MRAGLDNTLQEMIVNNEKMRIALEEERIKVIGLIQDKNVAKGKQQCELGAVEQDFECAKVEVATLKAELENYREVIEELREKLRFYDGLEQRDLVKGEEIKKLGDSNRAWRLKVIKFVSELAAAESKKKAAERECKETSEILEDTRRQVRLLQCLSRQNGTPVKATPERRSDEAGDQSTSISHVSESISVHLDDSESFVAQSDYRKALDAQEELKQRLTEAEFALKAQVQAGNSAMQRSEKLERLLGEKNKRLLKHFRKDQIVEELKSALHQSHEKYEQVQQSMTEAEKDVCEMRKQLDENVEAQLALEQVVGELRGDKGNLENRLRMASQEMEVLRMKVSAARENAEESNKIFVEDIRARLKEAEDDLVEEQRRRGEVTDKANGRIEAALREQKKTKDELIRAEGERDEGLVKSEEMKLELEATIVKVKDLEEKMKKLVATNDKNVNLLKIEANRRLLDARLIRSPLLTPGGLMKRGSVLDRSVTSTPSSAFRSHPPTRDASGMKSGGRKIGQNLNSAFKSVVRQDVGVGTSPLAATPQREEEHDRDSSKLTEEPEEVEILEQEVSKWKKCASSLQAALDAAVSSREAMKEKCVEERVEKEKILEMFEKVRGEED